jgi:hypothetical protein
MIDLTSEGKDLSSLDKDFETCLYDHLIESYDLPNATGGYQITGFGKIEIEDHNVVLNIDTTESGLGEIEGDLDIVYSNKYLADFITKIEQETSKSINIYSDNDLPLEDMKHKSKFQIQVSDSDINGLSSDLTEEVQDEILTKFVEVLDSDDFRSHLEGSRRRDLGHDGDMYIQYRFGEIVVDMLYYKTSTISDIIFELE